MTSVEVGIEEEDDSDELLDIGVSGMMVEVGMLTVSFERIALGIWISDDDVAVISGVEEAGSS